MLDKDNNYYDITYTTNEGYYMKVVKYNNYDDVIVEILDEYGHKVKTGMGNVKKGKVKNPYHRSVHNMGYFGVGKYKSRENYKLTNSYKFWKSMIQRCYDKSFLMSHPEYKECTVCEEWHNFQNFAKWFDDNYYNIEERIMNLDKDILCKGNKIYSPSTCVFVPDNINLLFANHTVTRGKYPIGVTYEKRRGMFDASMSVKKYKNHLGLFNTPEEAFYAYKTEKEKYIKEIADLYRDRIPIKLYEALYAWKIEIDD